MIDKKALFRRFDDIDHLPLKTWNRVVTLHNILDIAGKETLAEYLDVFEEWEKKQIYIMQAYIEKFGVERARKEVLVGFTPTEDIEDDQKIQA